MGLDHRQSRPSPAGTSAPRPWHTYRATRRNRALRNSPLPKVWGPNWYVARHRANYAQGFPPFAKPPGRYPAHMQEWRHAYLALKAKAREVRKQMLLAMTAAGDR